MLIPFLASKHSFRCCRDALYAASFGPAGASQALVYTLLVKWGLSGFEAYLRRLQAAYCGKARALAASLREHCGTDVAFHWPAGGMFIWATVPMVDDFEDLMPDMAAHKARPSPLPCPPALACYGIAVELFTPEVRGHVERHVCYVMRCCALSGSAAAAPPRARPLRHPGLARFMTRHTCGVA